MIWACRGPLPAAGLGAALLLLAPLCACQTTPVPATAEAAEEAPATRRGEPLSFYFPPAGDESEVSSESTRGRVTALLFITMFDIASQVSARRLGEVLVALTPRANAAAVVIEPPLYAELLPTYRESLSLPYPVVMADYATQSGTGPFGNIAHVPTLVVLDREGRETFRHQGPLEADDIERALRRAGERGPGG
jgi:hypothetical protein